MISPASFIKELGKWTSSLAGLSQIHGVRTLALGVVLTCVSLVDCAAQLFVHHQYTVEDGLSHNLVYRVFQHESTGYLWFGTEAGLDRFNGNTIQSFNTDVSLRQGVLAISEANGKSLHVGFFESGIFQVDVLQNNHASVLTDDIRLSIKLATKRDGSVVALTTLPGFLLESSPEGKIDTLYALSDTISDFVMDSDENIYLSTASGLVVFDSNSHYAYSLPLKEELVSMQVVDDQLWLANSRSIGRLTKDGQWLQSFAVNEGESIELFLIDRSGACWVTLESGALLYFDHGRRTDAGKQLDLEGLIVQDITEDMAGNVWLATRRHGVIKIEVIRSALEYQDLPAENPYLEAGTQLPDGTLIIGGDNALLACKDGECHSLASNFPDVWVYVYDALTLGKEAIISTNNGVYRYQHWDKPLERLVKETMGTIVADSAGIFYLSCITTGEVFSLNEGEPLKLLFHSNSRVHTSLHQNNAYWVFADSAIQIYSDSQLTELRYPENFFVNDAVFDAQNKLWCATNRGLFSHDSDGWEKFTEQDGYSSTNYLSLAIDNFGNVWLGNSHSIECRLSDGSVRTVLSPQTLNNSEVAVLLSDDGGNLHVGTSTDFFTLLTPNLQSFSGAPRLVVEHLNIGHRKLDLPLQEALFVEHDQADFTVKIDLIDLANWKGTKVEFRLLPLVNEWTEVQNLELRFNELTSNDYHFELRTNNPHYDGAAAALEVDFTVNPPWWASGWARVGEVIVALALMGFLLKLINDFQRNRYQQKIDLELLKMRALNNHLNPHFLSNALNSIKHLLRSDKTPSAMRYISQFAYLMRKNLEHQELNSITVKEEISMLDAYLSIEQLRFENHFQFEIILDDSIDRNARMPFMIVQPFVENAIWHGLLPLGNTRTGKVEVRFSLIKDKQRLKIEIKDNGEGYQPRGSSLQANGHTSSGISMSKRRLTMMDKRAQLNMRSRHTDPTMKANGTEVTVIFSMKKVHSKITTFVH